MNRVLLDRNALVFTLENGTLKWTLPKFPLSEPSQDWTPVNERWESDGGMDWGTMLFASGETTLNIAVRIYAARSIVRLRYSLSGGTFKGADGARRIVYGKLHAPAARFTEIQLGQFDRILHSFVPDFRHVSADGRGVAGPLLLAEDGRECRILGYEHGAQQPDHFLELIPDDDGVTLVSTKGNYFDGQPADAYLAPWIELGVQPDIDRMLRAYREFMLRDIAPGSESRYPYIFYNTWHFQEGRKYLYGDSVLKDMNEEFILGDIRRAHELGVEVYVIDTGWFQKTGVWAVNERFFSPGMQRIRAALDGYGMKLGVWLNPVVAAQTSSIYAEHPEYVIERDGEKQFCGKIWETEESWGMCLDTEYGDWFIEQLVRLYNDMGVRYFKWDAVGQYGCNSPLHGHGDAHNSPAERADAYAYRMGLQMVRIVEELTRRCPGAIVDFDVTEGGRFMGLGFLSVGKYFLINNGPYYSSFDIPESFERKPDTINVFFFPGAARAEICRQGVLYDGFIPSVLFLTHFLPHGDALSDENNLASMALGGNGIWGYLEQMTPEGVRRWHEYIEKYKRVRDALTRAYPVTQGRIGSSPEIIEKLDTSAGCGCVFFFTHAPGTFRYRTQPLDCEPAEICGYDSIARLTDASYEIEVALNADEARTVFFLPRKA